MDPAVTIFSNLLKAWAQTPNDWRFASACLSVLVTIPVYHYYYKAVRGAEEPTTMSAWLSWLLLDLAILAGMIKSGAVVPQVVVYTIGTAWVFWGCYQRGFTLGWTRMDTGCLVVVVICAALLLFTKDAVAAIMLSTLACVVATIPMVGPLYRNPRKEPMLPWGLVSAGTFFALIALRKFDLENAFTPAVFLPLQLSMFVLTLRRYQARFA